MAMDVFAACYRDDEPSIVAGASQLLLISSNMPLECRVEACVGTTLICPPTLVLQIWHHPHLFGRFFELHLQQYHAQYDTSSLLK